MQLGGVKLGNGDIGDKLQGSSFSEAAVSHLHYVR